MTEVRKRYIRSQVCLVDKVGTIKREVDQCYGRVDPHHLSARGMGGRDGGKTDETMVPLCRKHHSEVEQIGVIKFQVKYEIDLKYELSVLRKQWGLYQRRVNNEPATM